MQWQFGDWESLARVPTAAIESDPTRGYLALLVACACQQIGDEASARRHLKNATEWGCERRQIVELLAAGVHNTLGRVAAISGDETRAFKTFSRFHFGTGGRSQAGLSSPDVTRIVLLGTIL